MQVLSITGSNRTCERTVVRVAGANDVSDAKVRAFAMREAGETPERTFGSNVVRFPDDDVTAVVLNTD